MLEAMSAECLLIASDTPPVTEVVEDGVNGLLVPCLDPNVLANTVIDCLRTPAKFREIRVAARETILKRYDLHRLCLPKLVAYVKG